MFKLTSGLGLPLERLCRSLKLVNLELAAHGNGTCIGTGIMIIWHRTMMHCEWSMNFLHSLIDTDQDRTELSIGLSTRVPARVRV